MSLVSSTSRYTGFTPQAMGSLMLWLDGADPLGNNVLPSNGEAVNTWYDKSGKSNNAVKYVTCNAATYTSNALNGRGCLYFSGSSVYTLTTPVNPASNAFSVYLVGRADASNRNFISSQGTTGLHGSFYVAIKGDNVLGIVNTSDTPQLVNFTSIALGTDYIIASTFFGSNLASVLNGTSNATNTFSGSPKTASTTFVGANFFNGSLGTAGHIGNIYEVMLFTTPHTTIQRQAVEGYLANKWGMRSVLPTSHPYKTVIPFLKPAPTPLDFPSCVLWLDAADICGNGTIPANGVAINAWMDKSGTSNHAIRVSGYNGATYMSNFRNGLGGLNFGGSNTYILSNAIFASNALTSYVVGRPLPHPLNGTVSGNLITGRGATSNHGGFYVALKSDILMSIVNTADAPLGTNQTTTMSNDMIASCVFNNSTTSAYVNGTTLSTASFTGTAKANTQVYVGNNFFTGGFTNYGHCGYIYEIILYNSAHTYAENQIIEGYLAKKWGLTSLLPTSHTFRLYPALTVPFVVPQVPGLSLWLDAADTNTFTLSGSNISQWRDKAQNITFTQGGTASRLTLTTNQGKNVVYVNSDGTTNAYMTGSLALPANFTIAQVLTPLAYAGGTWGFIWSWNTGGTNGRVPGFRSSNASPDFQPYITWVGNGTNRIPVTYGTTYVNVVEFTNSSANTRYSINGNTLTSGTLTATNTTPTTFILGGDGPTVATSFGRFYMSEILMFSTVFTTSQRQQLEGYLAWKWGLQNTLPSTHPYYKSGPI